MEFVYMWEILSSLMWHNKIHYLTYTILFSMQQSYGFVLNSQFYRLLLKYFQNNNSTCRFQYIVLLNWEYRTSLLFFSILFSIELWVFLGHNFCKGYLKFHKYSFVYVYIHEYYMNISCHGHSTIFCINYHGQHKLFHSGGWEYIFLFCIVGDFILYIFKVKALHYAVSIFLWEHKVFQDLPPLLLVQHVIFFVRLIVYN